MTRVVSENRVLAMVLALLCLVVVVLAGFVVVGLNHGDEEVAVTDEEEFEPGEVVSEERINEYNDYKNAYNAARAKAQELLAGGAGNTDEVVELYARNADERIANNELDRASAFIRAQTEDLIAAGFKREALDALLGIDFSVFDKSEQYRQYTTIIQLATELGDNGAVAKYEPLAAEVKDVYDATYAATERSAAERAARKAANQTQGGD